VSNIVEPTPSDGTYNWMVPSITEGPDFTVVITSTTNGTIADTSDANFTIQTSAITVTSPNGGEIFDIGNSYDITWTDNISEPVQIDLFKAGLFISTITPLTPSDGSFNWTVPDITQASDYTIVITSTATGAIADTSDAGFTIQISGLNVSSPNGGEVWELGSSHDITWTDNIAEDVKIELFKAGVFFQTIVDPTPSDGTYNWTVPAVTQASDYTIVVTSKTNSTIADTSDANFTLQTSAITVISPNGGENWQSGIDHTITWTDNISENVKIELYKGGLLNFTITASTPSTGSFTWSVSSGTIAATDYSIVITSVNNGAITDASNSNFNIFDSEITLTFPNGGEVLNPGTIYQIKWDPTIFSENVKIELYKGGSPIDTVLFPSVNNDGSHNWEVWNYFVPDNDYRIRISKVGDDSIFDFSDADFTIAPFSPFIIITAPNGGEVWQVGIRHFIEWTDNIPEIPENKIKFELWKGGVLDTVLFDAEDPDGSKIWDIPYGTTLGNDYKVKLLYVNDTTVTSISDANFSLVDIPQITVTSPNGGESWQSGIQHTITWTDNIPDNQDVKIDLYKGGVFFTELFAATPADDSKFVTFPVSTPTGTDYKIRITSLDNPAVFDTSDAEFGIYAPITITSPNGGENWLSGSTQEITWSDSLVEDVKIDL
ncbi:MAG: Ser-Thr-rich GPI-anchored membrane family protein, partial [Ignavibacteriaceae bacterium]